MSDFMSGGMADKAKDLAQEHGDKVGDFVDEKTGGKYSEQIDQAQEHLGVQDSGADQGGQAPQEGQDLQQERQDPQQAAQQQAQQYGDQAAGTEYGETVDGQAEGFGGEQSNETGQGGSQLGGESQSNF